MKIAKASPEDVEAILNLMRVLNTAAGEEFPCKPDGTWDEGEDMEWFDPQDPRHLRKFYDRVMGCFTENPGSITRCIGGFHLAMTNNVWDPDADCYEWHPTLLEAVEKRAASPENADVDASAHKQTP